MISLTIFTPTFNRAETIVQTYDSLLKQHSFDFEWLIVDDGSTDDTEKIVKQWINEAPFLIRYIKQKNGGKYRAYNNGLRNANGILFFCVDSDDWLPDNSISDILNIKNEIYSSDSIAGCIALKEFQDKTLIGKCFPPKLHICSLQEIERLGLQGERSIIFKTSIAKTFLFPEETNEKFMTEAVVYDRITVKYDFLIKNIVLTTCEYQINGLSSNPRKLMLNNPAGYKLYFSQRIDMAYTMLQRIKYAISYNAFKYIYGGRNYEYEGCHKVLVHVLNPIGIILAMLYKRNNQ